MAEEMPDAKQVKEILQVVSEEIPKLLESITNAIYDEKNATNFGKAVAEFYKQMKAAGMDDKQAYELTQKYMTNFSLGGMIGNVFSSGKGKDSEE